MRSGPGACCPPARNQWLKRLLSEVARGGHAGLVGTGRGAGAGSGWAVRGCHRAVEGVGVELAEPGGVGKDVDFGDLGVPDGERHDRGQFPVRRDNCPGGPVDQGGPDVRGKPPEHDRLPGDRARPAHQPGDSVGCPAVVCPGHHAGVEQGDKRAEVTGAGGGEECDDQLPLASQVGVWDGGRRLHAGPIRQPPDSDGTTSAGSAPVARPRRAPRRPGWLHKARHRPPARNGACGRGSSQAER
jgi:hypothetical protein